jgi:predicted acylesterase/phospholipase RssA
MDKIPLYESKRKKILVIGGGGLKGFAALGSCSYLYENNILTEPTTLCGTSIGGILCVLLAIGFKPEVIYKLLCNINFENIVKPDYDKFFFGPDHYGFSSVSNLIDIVIICFEQKNFSKNITFKELFDKTGKKVIITGTCVNKYYVEYFSIDTHPNQKIIDTLQITISIPVIVDPVKLSQKQLDKQNNKDNNSENNYENYWVDGGVMDNYPIQLFNNNLDDVIGIYMYDEIDEHIEIKGFDEYFMALLRCFWKGSNFYKIENYKKQTIVIKCDLKQDVYFNISADDKLNLYKIGYESAKKYYS